MYNNLNSSKETIKKDLFVLDKKYKKAQQKNKSLDNDLKTTREQVSEFKQRFRTLSTFIQKKGGIEVLNSLPNQNTDAETPTTTGQFDDSVSMRSSAINTQKITLKGQAPSSDPVRNKKIRGGAGRGNHPPSPPTEKPAN